MSNKFQIIGRTRPRSAPTAVLRNLFGLTRQEAAAVSELLRAGTVHEAAIRLAVSHETIRSHLKSIFRKCDVHSKAELLSLLHCLSIFA